MESENKPSVHKERGALGSAEDLDEYGVWIKCEPEDIDLDDRAFFGGEQLEITEAPEAESLDDDSAGAHAEVSPAITEEAPDVAPADANADFTQYAEEAPYVQPEEALDALTADANADFVQYAEEAPYAPPEEEEAGAYASTLEASSSEMESGVAEPPADENSNVLMIRIADELSLMKSELNGIKTAVSMMQNNQTRQTVPVRHLTGAVNKSAGQKASQDGSARRTSEKSAGTRDTVDEIIPFDELRELLDDQIYSENANLPETEVPPYVDVSMLDAYMYREVSFIDLDSIEYDDMVDLDLAVEDSLPSSTAYTKRKAAITAPHRPAAAYPKQTNRAVAASASGLDSMQFKTDLQVVLSYMDRLLEALPEEKIEEFARSKQFDTYKKIFAELGLV